MRAYGITNCMYHNNKSGRDLISEPIRKEIGLPLHLVTCLKGGDSNTGLQIMDESLAFDTEYSTSSLKTGKPLSI